MTNDALLPRFIWERLTPHIETTVSSSSSFCWVLWMNLSVANIIQMDALRVETAICGGALIPYPLTSQKPNT